MFARTSDIKGDAIIFPNLKFVLGSHVSFELCTHPKDDVHGINSTVQMSVVELMWSARCLFLVSYQ